MKAAIYSRKSKYTGKGESIENQVQLCKEYCISYLKFKEGDFIIYEDEGFSGGTTRRPEFQRMMLDAKHKRFNLLICYRLDRVSRNVSDFSNLIEDLKRNSIDFISIREQFDTTNPMGRAMMYIASVFSQLERETIAQRIRDNMLELAKTGRWLGGMVPTGFKSEPVVTVDSSGKERRMYKLQVIPEEECIVRLIYEKYLILKSITRLEKYFVVNRINTKNGGDFQRYSLRFILSNPVYATADKEIYSYLIDNKYEIYSGEEDFNSINGLIGYNKTIQDKEHNMNRVRASSEWIIAVGKHKGIIPGHMWIEAQNLLEKNKNKAYRKVKNNQALLSGMLKCGSCGSYMRPKAMQRKNIDGQQVFYYMCEMKEKSRKTRCTIQNLTGNALDRLVLDEIKKIIKDNKPIIDHSNLQNAMSKVFSACKDDEITVLKNRLCEIDEHVDNIIASIESGQKESVIRTMYMRLEKLEQEKQEVTNRIGEAEKQIKKISILDSRKVTEELTDFKHGMWQQMNIENKREMIKSVVDKIIWDGERIHIVLWHSKIISELFPQCDNRK